MRAWRDPPRRLSPTARVPGWVALSVVVGVLAVAGARPAHAGKEGSERVAPDSPGAVFGKVAAGFESGDAPALAALVHSEGLTVTDHGERSSEYSPSQAVYFFKNLFQGQRTLLFAYRMTQGDVAGGRARAMADWKRRRVDSERVVELQIVLVLALDEGRWRLAEINMIR